MSLAIRWLTIALSLIPLAGVGSGLGAELKLACLFADHGVLQRDKAVPVWGWAEAGQEVTVSFAGQTKTTKVESDGRWRVQLDPMPANQTGQVLLVRCGQELREIHDLLVGEVWLGAGQSNMAMTVSRARNFELEKAQAELPWIRHFKEVSTAAASPREDGQGTWEACSPATVGSFSATLYFFGRALSEELHVPIGLINSSVGGTPIESWIDAGLQRAQPELKEFFESHVANGAAFDEAAAKAAYQKSLERWEQSRLRAKNQGKPLPARPRDPVALFHRKHDIGGLFNGKIAPLIPYAIRGFLWYQGEANAHPGVSQYYQYQLPLLVQDWRRRWGEELPAAWVQLPGFVREGEDWMVVRDAMLKTLRLPRTGMAITTDIGEANDIHPQNKQEVGRRLALWAQSEAYHLQVPASSGPIPIESTVQGNEFRVRFRHAEGGLKALDGDLDGFLISGTDNLWKPAHIRIAGDEIFASHPEVASPQSLRYNWADLPDGDFANGFNLPATPFRLDAPR